MRAALLLSLALLVIPGAAVAAAPTDIARVDDYIDAPRALFGRTRAEPERRLGVPTQERLRAGTIVLFWPGLEVAMRSEEHTSELQSLAYLVCRLLLEKKKTIYTELPT